MNSEESSYLLIDAINGTTSVVYSRKLKRLYFIHNLPQLGVIHYSLPVSIFITHW